MGVRIGVDVGGTFTKAVAIDLNLGAIVGQSVLPTSHSAPEGVAEGIVQAVHDVAQQVGAANVELVTHSTTQAVNALLEGDVGSVGVIGMGRRPELKRARQRTQLRSVKLSPGKQLTTLPAFFDVTDGLDESAVKSALVAIRDAGVDAVSTAEAFAPDDATNEVRVAEMAAEMNLPSCASTELSGLYGLELRAVTAAINASILPIAVRTAGFVAQGVAAAGITAPVMVMRGDGGATDLEGFQTAPARTLYSGPAASVAGALRHTGVADGVVVEVGGTSTNVAVVRFGRPTLNYVRVASHATALRAVDVRVVGVAGGSMLRVRKQKVYGVGPRSAHIAGLAYACYTDPSRFVGARPALVAPRADDPADYLVVQLTDGEQVALTNTCAANLLEISRPTDYCYAAPAAAAAAFRAASELVKAAPEEIARRMLVASGEAVAELISNLLTDAKATRPSVVAVGGGAGGLGRYAAGMVGLDCTVPEGAEVISSIGDALSLIRAERERTLSSFDPTVARAMMEEVENEALAAGATAASIEVRVEEQPETGTVRAVATGAVGLASGATPGRRLATAADVEAAAVALGGGTVVSAGLWWLAVRRGHVAVFDRFAEPTAEMEGQVADSVDEVAELMEKLTRYRGPITLRPSVWVLDGAHLLELSSGDAAASALAMADAERDQTFIVGRN